MAATNAAASSAPRRPRVLLVVGTRPEAIKMFPLIRALRAAPAVETVVVVTGQHRQMVDAIFAPLGIVPDIDLDLIRGGPSLNELVHRMLPLLEKLLDGVDPALVVVQGDTTTAFCAALAAFHRRVPVAHVEAGLRSFDRALPFPEEANRRMISQIAELHFAPTSESAGHLRREGVAADALFVTGNTAVDAILQVLAARGAAAAAEPARPHVLVTLHRRESWLKPAADAPAPIEAIFAALARVATRRPDVTFTYPVHPNPEVRGPAERLLGHFANVHLLPPQPYFEFVERMAAATLILTDSGGIQEEAPTLGIPVLVVRDVTERPEGVAAGLNRLVGTDGAVLERELLRELAAPPRRRGALPRPNPYGDGRAAERIAAAILHRLAGAPRPDDFVPELERALAAAR